MFDTIEEYEEDLEKRRKRYNPRNGTIHPEETFEERNRTFEEIIEQIEFKED